MVGQHNMEIIEARKELEKLKERERQLEARMGNRRVQVIAQHNGSTAMNNFEDLYNQDTKKYRESYGELSDSAYVKLNRETKEIQEAEDEEIDGRRRSRLSKTNPNKEEPLIYLSDNEEDAEILKVFESDQQNSQLYMNSNHSGYEKSNNESDGAEEWRMSDSSTEQMLGQQVEQYDELYRKELGHRSFREEEEEYEDEDEDEDNYEERRYSLDKRQDVQHDIEEDLRREQLLKFERGSVEDVYRLHDNIESEEEEQDMEDTREKIMREIAEEKLREIEQHAKNQEYGFEHDDEDEQDVEEQSDGEQYDPRDLISLEIQQLREREYELKHLNPDIYKYNIDAVESDEKEQGHFVDPSVRIEQEIREQQEREVELNQMRRTLSNENLLLINDLEEVEERPEQDVDIREKIYREMEELKIREKELRTNDDYKTEYDIINLSREELEDPDEQLDVRDKINQEIYDLKKREEELRKHYNYSFVEQPSYEVIMMPDEQLEETRELPARGLKDTDKKKFGSREDLVAFYGTHSEDHNVVKKTHRKPSPNRVRIPKVFTSPTHTSEASRTREGNRTSKANQKNKAYDSGHYESPSHSKKAASNSTSNRKNVNHRENSLDEQDYVNHNDNALTQNGGNTQNGGLIDHETDIKTYEFEPYFHDEIKPMKASKKRLVRQRKRSVNERKGLLSQDVNKEEKMNSNTRADEKSKKQGPNSSKIWHIHPIAAKWEKKGEEERQRKRARELELQERKEERLRYLAEKAEHERQLQLLREEEERAKKKREWEIQILRAKQQGLNQLWTSKKPIVTVADNPDQDDTYLLKEKKRVTPRSKQASKTTPTKETNPIQSIAISKKIQRWEKKIAKVNAAE